MPSVELLFGPMLIGAFLNTILYGVLLVQTFIYWRTYRNDSTWLRYFILYLVVVETLNTGMDIAIIYEPMVKRYATPHATKFVPLMLYAEPLMTGVISTPIQLFVAWRIKVISGSWVMASIICFFATCSFIGSLAGTIAASLFPEYEQLQDFKPAIITWLTSSAAADVLITVSLVWSLYKRRSNVSKKTNAVVDRIIRLTVQTGLITAISAIVDVVTFTTVTHSTMNFVFDFALGKLYTNSLLSTLNARAGWDKLNNAGDDDNVLFGPRANSTGPSSAASRKKNQFTADRSIYTSTTIELQVPGQTVSYMGDSVDLETGTKIPSVGDIR